MSIPIYFIYLPYMLRMNRLILLDSLALLWRHCNYTFRFEKNSIYHTHKVRDIRRTINVNLILNVKKSSPSNIHFTLF